MKISYNWLKWYVPEIPEPNRLADIFTYHICEVESVEKLAGGDYVFDLGILPNRAHDLLSHHGVTVAKNIILEDPIENLGASLIKQAASKTADKAGDGTTTSTLLAQKIRPSS
jgi:hypothetical protein